MPSDCKLERCQTELTMFNQSKRRVLGKCRVNIKNPKNRKKYKADFIAVKQAPDSVLGAPVYCTANGISHDSIRSDSSN